MPHKHKRKRTEDDAYDLPVSSSAKSSLAHAGRLKNGDTIKRKNTKTPKPSSDKSLYKDDDTPRDFARLLALQKNGRTVRSGLDDGTGTKKTGKKRRGGIEGSQEAGKLSQKTKPSEAESTKAVLPRILPGESLRDFSARVDTTLPLANVSTSNGASRAISKSLGLKEHTTRHNKRLQRMIAQWRAEEEKMKEKEQERVEEAELDEEFDEDEDGTKRETKQLWKQTQLAGKDQKGKKVRTKKRMAAARGLQGEDVSDSDDDDPWRKLSAKKLAETKQRSLQDVVQAPPTLKGPGQKLKVVENIPKRNTVSSRSREELALEREKFLQGWRKMKGLKSL
ncbi:hypothetical protein UCRPC4_g00959 [Phaeomoniella chlamydospora]|uniref:Urease accessory protein n=1 Tax=Phaeomoniella chlamydospora TaxID=158046 RepID=A0A0G2HH01_PHACM|nr:hypothetical protein UCRPC4_g00959 [Phaeomoniella chlamydospora]